MHYYQGAIEMESFPFSFIYYLLPSPLLMLLSDQPLKLTIALRPLVPLLLAIALGCLGGSVRRASALRKVSQSVQGSSLRAGVSEIRIPRAFTCPPARSGH